MHIWIGGRPKQTKGLYLGKEHIKRYLVILKLVFFFVQFNYGFEAMLSYLSKNVTLVNINSGSGNGGG